MASIAAVARLRIVSRAAGAFETLEKLVVCGSTLVGPRPVAPTELTGQGTAVEVKEFLGGSWGAQPAKTQRWRKEQQVDPNR